MSEVIHLCVQFNKGKRENPQIQFQAEHKNIIPALSVQTWMLVDVCGQFF